MDYKTKISKVCYEEGQSIEEKMRLVTETNIPIDNVVPIVYTERKDGVKPEYDFNTDKWEIAQNAMDYANKKKREKAAEYTKLKEGEQENANT